MNKSLHSIQRDVRGEHRLVLLWLLFLFVFTAVSPLVSATSAVGQEMACGSSGCLPADNCEESPALPELGVFVVPVGNSTPVRLFAQVPGMTSVLYTCLDPSTFSRPILKASDPPPIFVPLLVMGPAHAAHAPPVA